MKKILAGATLVIFGLISGSGVAYADQECLKTPEKTTIIKHDAVTHQESRWKRDIPEVKEISHIEYQFKRDVPAVDEVSHLEYRFVRTNPGSKEVSHLTWRLSRQNPGKQETSHSEFKYKKIIPAVEGVKEFKYKKLNEGTAGIKEFEYKKCVDNYKTEYRYVYKKKVSGDVYKVKNNQKVGTFDWEWFEAPTWNGGPLTHWGAWGFDSATEDSGPHSSTSNQYTVNGEKLVKKSTQYKYFKTDQSESRQVKDGTQTCTKDWFTTNPGSPWKATGDWRWKVEPVDPYYEYSDWTTEVRNSPWIQTDWRWKVEPKPEQIVYYNDGNWTTDVKTDPWILIDTRTVGNGDAIPPFTEWATKTGRTTIEAEADYFTEAEIATFDRGWSKFGEPKKVVDSAAIDPFDEYKTTDGVTTNVDEADWFVESAFEGWNLYGEPKKVVTSEAIPGYTLYRTLTGESKNIADAAWFKESSFEGWTQFNSKTVIDTAYVPGYTEYYVPDGAPTRELGDSNWTTDTPEGWTFVDERTVTDKAAWEEKKTTPAKYGECTDTLAYTGSDPLIPIGIASGLILLGLMGIGIRRHHKANV